jgi:SAM-dependent methyltransferase
MPQPTAIAQFADALTASLADGTFVRLILTRPCESGLEKLLVRHVELKTGPHLSLTYRYATRDVTKNIPDGQAAGWIREQLPGQFGGALLSTTAGDYQLTGERLIRHKPTFTTAPTRSHDRQKNTFLDDSAQEWLTALQVSPKKRQQIDRYLEIVSHLAAEVELNTIADMGCGKGYLTFGLWHLLRKRIIGVEQRPELVAASNDLARRIGATGLEFVAGTINTVKLPAVDALIALHACDTATDDAIRRGIELGAKLIIVAPCCHKELRPKITPPAALSPVFAHGIMAERLAEWATDGLRALRLEAAGYRTKVCEFVPFEHTPKNIMIAGIYTGKPAGCEQLEAYREFFGLVERASRLLPEHTP